MIDERYQHTLDVLSAHSEALHRVAESLLVSEVMDREQFVSLAEEKAA